MPRRGRRSRRAWVLEEKGEYGNYFTVKEFANRLSVSEDTIDRWERVGKIPPHDVRSTNGWRLWRPDVVSNALQQRLRGSL